MSAGRQLPLILAWFACAAPEESEPARLCNGAAELCGQPLDAVPLLVTHNAMNVSEGGWIVANQHFGYERQVADGVRGFMLDVHDLDGVPTLCHGDCALGSEDLVLGLERFDALLEANPDDVFVFVIEDQVEVQPVVAAVEEAGLLDDVIASGPPWATLGELIDAGTRLLVTHESSRPGPPWYHPTYELAWDNDYAAETVADFDCAVLRGDPANEIFLMNHFLTAPVGSEFLAADANTSEALWDHVDRCEAETGDRVTWLAVDFYDVGDALEVVGALAQRVP